MEFHPDKIIKVKSTKIVEQYFELEEQYKNKLINTKKLCIFMRVGDFYEIYGVENKTTGQLEKDTLWKLIDDLIIKISPKNQTVYNDKNLTVYMGGVPVISRDKYVNMAVEDYGWTIILINQHGEDKSIVRYEEAIISPGINHFSHNESNYLMTIYLEKIPNLDFPKLKSLHAGVGFIDCLTGDSGIIEYPYNNTINEDIIYDELLKLITIKNPGELIIYCDKCDLTEDDIVNYFHLTNINYEIYFNELPKNFTKSSFQKNIYSKVYGQDSIQDIISYLGIYDYVYCRIVLTILLDYIINRNINILEKIQKPTLYFDNNQYLFLANNALEQLNIIHNHKKGITNAKNKQSLFSLLNKTKTSMGKRLLKDRLMNPIINPDVLQERYQRIDSIYTLMNKSDTFDLSIFKQTLGKICDLKIMAREITRGNFSITSINSLLLSLESVLHTNDILKKYSQEFSLNPLLLSLETIKQTNSFIKSINNTFCQEKCNTPIYKQDTTIFKNGCFPEIDELNQKIVNEQTLIDDLCHEFSNKIDPKGYQKNHKLIITKGSNASLGHYIHGTVSRVKILEDIVKGPKFKSFKIGNYTLKKKDFNFIPNAKGKIRIDLECLNLSSSKLISYTSQLRSLLNDTYKVWLKETNQIYNLLLNSLSEFIAEIDLLQSCAYVAIRQGYSKPILDFNKEDNSYLDAKNLRHPIIEFVNQNEPYVPNDILIGKENINGYLLFGVNACGKSSHMKAIGVSLIMAQAGLYVPSTNFTFKPFRYLFTRILSNDNLYAGLSTFAVEMSEFKIIMKFSDKNSIILGDELCSGTETIDATAIVAAGITKLAERKANFIFATHLHYLSNTKYLQHITNVKKVHMSVSIDRKTDRLVYERKIKEGSGPSSYGILVCKAMKMDSDFMDLAQEIRNDISNDSAKILGKESKYNKQKIISTCEVCQIETAVDTHHIKFQCTADKNGMIESWHKDSKFNLVGLCKACHQDVHSSPPRLTIKGYQMTSEGIVLDYD